MIEEAQTSQQAGRANHNGLILVFKADFDLLSSRLSSYFLANNFFPKYTIRHMLCPKNMQHVYTNG